MKSSVQTAPTEKCYKLVSITRVCVCVWSYPNFVYVSLLLLDFNVFLFIFQNILKSWKQSNCLPFFFFFYCQIKSVYMQITGQAEDANWWLSTNQIEDVDWWLSANQITLQCTKYLIHSQMFEFCYFPTKCPLKDSLFPDMRYKLFFNVHIFSLLRLYIVIWYMCFCIFWKCYQNELKWN